MARIVVAAVVPTTKLSLKSCGNDSATAVTATVGTTQSRAGVQRDMRHRSRPVNRRGERPCDEEKSSRSRPRFFLIPRQFSSACKQSDQRCRAVTEGNDSDDRQSQFPMRGKKKEQRNHGEAIAQNGRQAVGLAASADGTLMTNSRDNGGERNDRYGDQGGRCSESLICESSGENRQHARRKMPEPPAHFLWSQARDDRVDT